MLCGLGPYSRPWAEVFPIRANQGRWIRCFLFLFLQTEFEKIQRKLLKSRNGKQIKPSTPRSNWLVDITSLFKLQNPWTTNVSRREYYSIFLKRNAFNFHLEGVMTDYLPSQAPANFSACFGWNNHKALPRSAWKILRQFKAQNQQFSIIL